MKQIFVIIFIVVAIVSLITFAFTFNQVNQEEERLGNDIQYRSSLLANSLKESIEPNFVNKSDKYLQSVVERFVDNQRIAGLAVIDNTGKIVAVSSSLPKDISASQQIATDVMDGDKDKGEFVEFKDKKMYVFAEPLHDKKSVVGALVVVQHASYIDNLLFDIWTRNLLRLFVQAVFFSIAVLLILRWIIYIPIEKLVHTLRAERLGRDSKNPHKTSHNPLFAPLIKEVSTIQQNLIQARLAASEEAKISLEKLDSPWTAERLKQFTKDILKSRKIVVVSNREPYIHTKEGNKVTYHFPASGMATAMEPVMQACGGLWIAHGSGNADKLVVDEHDKIQAPPYDPKYTLKRVWLTEEEEQGYYYGFSNQALYPLCLMAHTRPIFGEEDWEQYKKVNEKFADTVLSEIKDLPKPVILIQDFHFSLLPKLIKDLRPDATVGLFWHIPWVSPESFSICPWKKEILDGMLGADLIGFHTQLHANNFIETVGRELEALIDIEQFAVTKNDHTSFVKPFPASVAFSNGAVTQRTKGNDKKKDNELLKLMGIQSEYIGIGVDRLDYTKGILERFKAIELFLDKYPSYKNKFTFIQISPPSKSKIKKYQEFAEAVDEEYKRINGRFKTKHWKPIVLIEKHHSHKELDQYYKLADLCLVTSLHDGMNLVAKEFIAARNDEKGVLILSQFTGASKELKEALIINPYNGKSTADAIYTALEMKQAEQMKRMKKLRDSVKNYNIYRWSAEFLKVMVSLG